MNDPVWLSRDIVLAIHGEQLAAHGGLPGLRDASMLDSAPDRPRNKWAHEQGDLSALAAAYGYGLARTHPFADGNKRTALLAIHTFLGLNDVDFAVPEAEFATVILALAAGELDEDSLADWIRESLART